MMIYGRKHHTAWGNKIIKRRRLDSTDVAAKEGNAKHGGGKQPSEIMREYFEHSTLHGVRYIIQSENKFFRAIWIIACCICLLCALFFMIASWNNFFRSPIITSVRNTFYPLEELPFPAITICPGFNIKKRKGLEILHRNLSFDIGNEELNSTLVSLMKALCFFRYPLYHIMGKELDVVQNYTKLDKFDQLNMTQFMLETMPSLEEIFHSCYWQGGDVNCSEIFELQRFEGGICYSFNSQTSESCKFNPEICELFRNSAAGTTSGLEVYFKEIDPADHLGNDDLDDKGIRIMVHETSQLPEAGSGLFMLDNKAKVATVKIQPSITTSSNSLRSMTPAERQCFYDDERRLSVAPEYSQDACFIECRLNYIKRVCKCVPYFFWQPNGTMPECRVSDLLCIVHYRRNLRLTGHSVVHIQNGKIHEHEKMKCHMCLPTCDSVNYDIDAEFAENIKPTERRIGYLDVFYKDQCGVEFYRAHAIDKMNLIVSVGGIAGLFLGFSLLSIVEVIYYFCKYFTALYYKYKTNHTVKPVPNRQYQMFHVNNSYEESNPKQMYNRHWILE